MKDESIVRISAQRGTYFFALALLVVVGLLSACAPAPTVERTPAPTSAPTIIPTATLPPLHSEIGWHTVFTMGDMSGQPQNVQKSFTASKPYTLFFACQGSGTLTVSYGQSLEKVMCTSTAQLQGTDTQQPPHSGDTVTISAAPSGAIIWELLVSMQN